MNWLEQLQQEIKGRVNHIVGNQDRGPSFLNNNELAAFERKIESNKKRNAEIVKANVQVNIVGEKQEGQVKVIDYLIHYKNLIKQNKTFYMEEAIEERQAIIENGQLSRDFIIEANGEDKHQTSSKENNEELVRTGYEYDRRAAVQYAEEWWNSYNPKYKKFEVDCTNFISQCLHEGGAPMTNFTNRNKGWWYSGNNWSYSWSVAHAMRWYLSGSQQGLQAQEVESPTELKLGDIICYDFEGDGRFDHTTIVTAKDGFGEPLVNAHTSNSRMRYWSYEDSTAYTPNIKYKFFTIIDG